MSESLPATGRIAGVDFGQVRIGVAVTDPNRSISSPLENYTRRGIEADGTYFRKLVEEEQIVGFVVGLPLHMSGNESQKSREARSFGKWLTEQTGCPVVFQDERFSSLAADTLMGDASLTQKQRKKRRDMLAAQIILASFLERPTNFSENDGHFAD